VAVGCLLGPNAATSKAITCKIYLSTNHRMLCKYSIYLQYCTVLAVECYRAEDCSSEAALCTLVNNEELDLKIIYKCTFDK